MSRNGNTNGYVQVFEGPDGKPMVVLRADDLVSLINRVMQADKGRDGTLRKIPHLKANKMDDWLKATSAISDAIRNAGREFSHGDEEAYAKVKAALARGDDEAVPRAVAMRLVSGESPVKVWRKYRGHTQTELAEATGIAQNVISRIENNKRTGDVSTLKALADGLDVLVDDLVL